MVSRIWLCYVQRMVWPRGHCHLSVMGGGMTGPVPLFDGRYPVPRMVVRVGSWSGWLLLPAGSRSGMVT